MTANADIDKPPPDMQTVRMVDPLLQTRLPEHRWRLAKQAADREGLSPSAWLRRLVTLELERLVEEGKITPEGKIDDNDQRQPD